MNRDPGLLALLLTALLVAAGCGSADEPSPRGPDDPVDRNVESQSQAIEGRWHQLRATPTLTPEQEAEIERLRSIGYASGSQEARTESVVTIYDPDRAVDGLNFYTSGHAPTALLVDMRGKILHRWERSFEDVWPDEAGSSEHGRSDFWRRAWLYENGDILAIYEGMGLLRLDRDSNVIWARLNGAHHDVQVREDGTIVVLTRKAHLVERVHPTKPILEDFVTVLDPDGEVLREISVLECFERSDFARVGLRNARKGGDLLHTNTVEFVPEGDYPVSWLRPGHLMTSLRTPSALAVIDLEREVVVQAWNGPFNRQHDPSLVAGDRMLLFDNAGLGNQSRVIEVDLHDPDSIVWEYQGPAESPLSSWTCGTVERLPGGNTLITESDRGRALEIDSEGDVVWEYYNPHRVGTDPVYIATLFEVVRLPRSSVKGWLVRE